MMGRWMKTGTYFGIGVKLITISPSEAYWEGCDAQCHMYENNPVKSNLQDFLNQDENRGKPNHKSKL